MELYHYRLISLAKYDQFQTDFYHSVKIPDPREGCLIKILWNPLLNLGGVIPFYKQSLIKSHNHDISLTLADVISQEGQRAIWQGCCSVLFYSNSMNEYSPKCPRIQNVKNCKLKPTTSLREPVYLICGFPFFLLPSTFPSIIVFSRESHLLTMCPK